MIKLLSLLALSAACGLLSACAAAPTTPVWKYQTILIAPDASLLSPCPVKAPPSPAPYLAANDRDREGMMTDAYNAQTGNIGNCNKELVRVNDWVAKQKLLYPNATLSNGVSDLGGASTPVAASAPQ
jgi:hypothetical protein